MKTLLAFLFISLAAFGQNLTLTDGAFVGSINQQPGGGSCLITTKTNTIDLDYYQITDGSQGVKNASTLTVCQVDLLFEWGGSEGSVHLELWSTATGAGTQYGGNSSSISITSAAFNPKAWAQFTFSSMPAPTGDFFIRLVVDSGGAPRWRNDYNHDAGSGHYPFTDATDDAAYSAYASAANRPREDFCFKVYAQ